MTVLTAHTRVPIGTSLDWLRQDNAAADISRLLTSGSPPAAIAAGIRHILHEQLDLDYDHGPAGTALMLAWLLKHRGGSFTAAVAALTGEPVTVEPDHDSEREHRLSGAQAVALGICDEDALHAWSRRGIMMAGGQVAAEVDLTVVPARIGGWDGEALTRIRSGEPCGAVLPGVARSGRRAAPGWPRNPAVRSWAALAVAGRGFGFAREQVTAGLMTRLAYS